MSNRFRNILIAAIGVVVLSPILCCGVGGLIQPTPEELARIEAEQAAEQKREEEKRAREREERLAAIEKEAEEARRRNEQDLNAIREKMSEFSEIAVPVEVDEFGVTMRVSQAWHYSPYQVRLQMAQDLNKMWKSVRSDAGSSQLSLVDRNGNEVGGTGFTGVWVSEN